MPSHLCNIFIHLELNNRRIEESGSGFGLQLGPGHQSDISSKRNWCNDRPWRLDANENGLVDYLEHGQSKPQCFAYIYIEQWNIER